METALTITTFRSIQLAIAGSLIINIAAAAADPMPAGSYQIAQSSWSCRDYRGWDRERCRREKHSWRDEKRREEKRRDRRRDKKRTEAAIAAGVVGLAIGAVAIGAANQAEKQRHARCASRYSSYDSRSGTFVGRDGRLYRCQ
jgi:hypothetical protein